MDPTRRTSVTGAVAVSPPELTINEGSSDCACVTSSTPAAPAAAAPTTRRSMRPGRSRIPANSIAMTTTRPTTTVGPGIRPTQVSRMPISRCSR
jgi:hypothetical protein